jgi:hypothetical protein
VRPVVHERCLIARASQNNFGIEKNSQGVVLAYLKFGFLVSLTLMAGACVRTDDEFVVPLGHPADPGGRPGALLVSSGSLEPELQTIKPSVKPSSSKPAPSSGAQQHKH